MRPLQRGADAGGHTHPSASAFAVLPEARDALDAAGHPHVLLAFAGAGPHLIHCACLTLSPMTHLKLWNLTHFI